MSSLVSRSPGAHEDASSPRVELSVALDGSRELARGTLTVRLADGQEARRDIPEARCAEVVSTISVIAAMILDGGGLDAAPPTPSPPATPPIALPVRSEAAHARPSKAPGGTRLAALLGVGPQTGVAPSVVPRYFAGLGLVFERAGSFSPTIDVVASFAESGWVISGDGDARFRLLAAILTVCPWRWPLSSSVALRACMPLELGSLRGVGDNTVSGQTQYMPWVGLGGAGRAEFALSRAFRLELEARATVLGWSDRFVFEPDSVVHDVPRVALGLRIAFVAVVP